MIIKKCFTKKTIQKNEENIFKHEIIVILQHEFKFENIIGLGFI
jgi:hypothetical protein